MAISLSLGGPNTFVSDSSDSVLIGTVNGVVTLERAGNKWNTTKQYLDGCHIHAIVIVPDSPRIFAGACKGSIYGSADNGATWAVKENGLTQKNIYSLNYSRNGGRLYAGTEPGHLFQSADFGEN